MIKDGEWRKKELWIALLLGAAVILTSLKSTIFPGSGALIGGIITGFILKKGIKYGAFAGFLAGLIAVTVLTLAGLISNFITHNDPYILRVITGAVEFELLMFIPEITGGAIGGWIHSKN